MTPECSTKELTDRIARSGTAMAELNVAQGIRLMLDFYREVRADNCTVSANGDMLLFQWGVYGFGQAPTFQFDITRQFIADHPEDVEDEDTMTQLSFTFHFPPSELLSALGCNNRWCETPEESANFETFITGSVAYHAVLALRPSKVELDYEWIG